MISIIPIGLTIGTTVYVFHGGLKGWYTMDIRIAIALMLASFNLMTFLIFAFDKFSAIADGCRVPELLLIYLAWYGSPFGALLGMYCCCHKINKTGFTNCIIMLLNPVLFIL